MKNDEIIICIKMSSTTTTKELLQIVLEYSENIFMNTLEYAVKMDIQLSKEDLLSLSKDFHKNICDVVVKYNYE